MTSKTTTASLLFLIMALWANWNHADTRQYKEAYLNGDFATATRHAKNVWPAVVEAFKQWRWQVKTEESAPNCEIARHQQLFSWRFLINPVMTIR